MNSNLYNYRYLTNITITILIFVSSIIYQNCSYEDFNEIDEFDVNIESSDNVNYYINWNKQNGADSYIVKLNDEILADNIIDNHYELGNIQDNNIYRKGECYSENDEVLYQYKIEVIAKNEFQYKPITKLLNVTPLFGTATEFPSKICDNNDINANQIEKDLFKNIEIREIIDPQNNKYSSDTLNNIDTTSYRNIAINGNLEDPFTCYNIDNKSYNGIVTLYQGWIEANKSYDNIRGINIPLKVERDDISNNIWNLNNISISLPFGNNSKYTNVFFFILWCKNDEGNITPYRRSEIYKIKGDFENPKAMVSLIWDAPVDLDLHLSNDDKNIHVYWKEDYRLYKSSDGGEIMLDIDNRKGYGPENLFFSGIIEDIEYDLFVNYFSNVYFEEGKYNSYDKTVNLYINIFKDDEFISCYNHTFSIENANGNYDYDVKNSFILKNKLIFNN